MGVAVGEYPSLIRVGLTEEEKRRYAQTLNLYRRHLTAEARAPFIRDLRAAGKTLQEIADMAGVGVGTVYRDLDEEESAFPSGKAERVTGRDGKSYPTRYRVREVVAKNRRELRRALAALAEIPDEDLPEGLIDVGELAGRQQNVRRRHMSKGQLAMATVEAVFATKTEVSRDDRAERARYAGTSARCSSDRCSGPAWDTARAGAWQQKRSHAGPFYPETGSREAAALPRLPR